jgi:hypothetical protein
LRVKSLGVWCQLTGHEFKDLEEDDGSSKPYARINTELYNVALCES